MRGIRCAAICVAITFLFPAIAVAAPQSGKAFIPPVDGEITKPFKLLKNSFGPGSHRGIDFGVPSGTPVKASGAGEVTFVGPVGGEGLFITISHEKGLETTYSYLSSTDVVKGQRVAQGDVIGKSGEGHPGEGAPALHFGAKKDGKYIDPEMLFQDFSDITELIRMIRVEEQSSGSSRPPPVSSAGAGGPGAGAGQRRPIVPSSIDGPSQIAPTGAEFRVPDQGQIIARDPSQFGTLTAPGVEPLDARLGGMTAKEPPRDLRAGSVGSVSKASAPEQEAIPSTRSPATIMRWWEGRTPEQRERLIAQHPKQIGQLVGIDASSRNKANRVALDREIAEIRLQRDRVMNELERRLGDPPLRSSHSTSASREVKKLYEELQLLNKRYAGATKLKRQLTAVADRTRDGLEPDDVYLLEFDTKFANGDGKAAVALGNPDTAKRVGIVVPGLGSRLEYIDGPLGNAANLRTEIHRGIGPGAALESSTIAWLGYDAPETLPGAGVPFDAMSGARALKQFVEGLRATYKGEGELGAVGYRERQHISIFGHSYGSSLTGLAGRLDVQAEDLVIFASPGSGGRNANDLGAPRRRIWTARTKDDPIKWGTGPAILGTDPTSIGFGARKVPLSSSQRSHRASAYYQQGSTGLLNFARIMTGRANEVK